MDELVAAEAALFARRRELKLTLLDEQGRQVAGSLPAASTALAASSDEAVRQSALAMFHTLEQWVVDNGYLAIVALRNRFARAMGYRDYFDYKVHKNEQMSPAQLFAILDDFIAGTEQRLHQSLAELKAAKGEAALLPHNLRYSVSGDVTRQLDPYVPFSRALQDWVESFRRLGIQYRGATLTLDLLTREGNTRTASATARCRASGRREWVPAVVNFTSLANPAQVGSGWSGLNTLFHEGGHAAHFANVTGNAPASPRSSRPPPWPTPRPSRCSATACWTMRTGSSATPETRRGADPRCPDQGDDRGAPAVSRLQRAPDRAGGLLRAGSLRHGRGRTHPTAVLALARRWERQILGWRARARCWPSRICSTRSRPVPITAICWR